jgi:hypothetical protein
MKQPNTNRTQLTDTASAIGELTIDLIVAVHQSILKQTNPAEAKSVAASAEPLMEKMKEYLKKTVDLTSVWLT